MLSLPAYAQECDTVCRPHDLFAVTASSVSSGYAFVSAKPESAGWKPWSDARRKRMFEKDTQTFNMYGYLMHDDPAYNPRYSHVYLVAGELGVNLAMWSFNRYVTKESYGFTSAESWKRNIREGWEWDLDRFGINFIGHPWSGTWYYNVARSSGYNYFESLPYAFLGSLMWEYFGETTHPSYNDIINTPVSGAALGEILYRLSSNILDDATTGRERTLRELCAGIVNPVRGINRLIQGKTRRVVTKEIYQKEPLNLTFFAGIRRQNNEGAALTTGPTNIMFNAQLDYGNPFEMRHRKPFDLFKLRTDFNFGVGRKVVDNVTGYGILSGRNFKRGDKSLLLGLFQYYDYWNSTSFELGGLGFGPGVLTRMPVPFLKNSNIYNAWTVGVMPVAGVSDRNGVIVGDKRDYAYGGGLETSFESTITFGRRARATFLGYYYWISDYVGMKENSFEGIIRPRITVNVYKELSIGVEQYVYFSDRYAPGLPDVHRRLTEPKIFLHLYLEDPKRRGRYN
jgi:hypothetical protein